MQTLQEYEDISGQLNKGDNIHFFLDYNTFNDTRYRIKRLSGFRQKYGALSYLGCPLFLGRPRIIYFSNLVNTVVCRITGWQMKQLSYSGREVLTKHFLQSLPIYLLFAITPPSSAL